jgi:hypothetical protein
VQDKEARVRIGGFLASWPDRLSPSFRHPPLSYPNQNSIPRTLCPGGTPNTGHAILIPFSWINVCILSTDTPLACSACFAQTQRSAQGPQVPCFVFWLTITILHTACRAASSIIIALVTLLPCLHPRALSNLISHPETFRSARTNTDFYCTVHFPQLSVECQFQYDMLVTERQPLSLNSLS